MTKKLLVFLSVVTGLLCVAFSVSASTTSDALEQYASQELVQSITGAEYQAPFVPSQSGTEDINPMSGALNLRVTDLILPGKNGFDLVISRTYNSQMMEKNNQLYRNSDLPAEKYAYRYTYGNNKSCYVLFASETEMLESGAKNSFVGYDASLFTPLAIDNIVPAYDCYLYSKIASDTGMVTYTRVVGEEPLIMQTFIGNGGFKSTDLYGTNGKTVALDQGWTLDLPRIQPVYYNQFTNSYDEDTGVEFSGYSGIFYDENGQQFPYIEYEICEMYEGRLEFSKVELIINPIGYYEGFLWEMEPSEQLVSLERTLSKPDGKSVNYDRIITHVDSNQKMYFNSQGLLVAKADSFGNSIFYYYSHDKKLEYIIDSYNRRIDFIWQDGQLSKITYGEREINYNWQEINDATADPHDEFETDNAYCLTVTNEEGESTVYHSDLLQPVYRCDENTVLGTSDENTDFDYAYLLKQIDYPTGGKTKYTYIPKQVKMLKSNSTYYGTGTKYKIVSRKDEQDGVESNALTYQYNIIDETLNMPNSSFSTTVTSTRAADNGRYPNGYTYTYKYTYKDKKLIKSQEIHGGYHRVSEKTYSSGSYGRLLTETNTEYVDDQSAEGLTQTTTYTYDDVGSVLTSTDGQTNTSNQYKRKLHLANGTSFPKILYRQAVSNGENRETVTVRDYVGRASNHDNYNFEGVALWRETVYDDTLNPDGSIVGGAGVMQFRRYYEYDDHGQITKITTHDIDHENNNADIGTGDIVNYSYTDYGTDQTRTVTETRKATDVVQDDGTISSQEQELTKTMTYDYYGNLIREEGDGIDTARYTYDNKNRLTKKEVLKENGVYSTVEYDYTVGSDTKTVITDELGAQTQVNYDPLGRYESTVLLTAGGNITTESVTYDDLGRVNRKTVSDGNGKSYSVFTDYWSSGKLYKEEIRDLTSNIQRKTEYYYTECWEDSDEYDTNAQRVEVIQTDGDATRTSYAFVDVYGNTKKAIDTAGGVTTYDFDSKGELESMKNPNDNANQTTTPSESYTYDYRGEPLTVTNADGNTATTEYDFLGRVYNTYDYTDNPTSTRYNLYGQVYSVSTLFDEYRGNIGPSTLPEEIYRYDSLTRYYYNSDGNVAIEEVKTTAPGETENTFRQVYYAYDEHNRLDYVKQTEDDGTDTYIKYFYDKKGNPLKVVTGLSSITGLTESNIPENVAVTTYEYHPYLNVVTKMILPDGTTQYYDYNYWGQIEEHGYLDEEGQKYGVVTTTYNTIGEMLSTIGEDDSGSSYTYNKFGDITQVVDDSGTRNFTYDTAGRLTNESGSNGDKAYTYDGNGNRTSFSLVQENQTIQEQTYTYDRLNRLTHVKDANSNILATYSYDANGNLTTETKGDNLITRYTYNYGSQLTGKINVVGGTVVSDYDYTYYMDGNIKSENNRTFTYDNLGRLKQEQDGEDTISYSYDRFGNRASMNNSGVVTSYTYDLNNRLLQEVSGNKTTFYNYDDRGNLYSKRTDETSSATDLLRVDFFGELKNNADSTVEMYFYNGLNRLEEVRKGGITAQYEYNAEGIRTSKTVNGITTDFYLDGANVIAESVNNVTTNYIRGATGIIHSEVFGSSNSRKYYTSDAHGNITNLINTSGSVVKSYTYDAFGVEENIDSADTNPFRYCGEYYDAEINQIYLRARYYDPSLGRFTQSDPAMADGYNWYVYCGNNPICFIDPSGYFSGQIYGEDGYGGIFNTNLYVNDRYGGGWVPSGNWGTLEPKLQKFLMNDFEEDVGNCTLTGITRILAYYRDHVGKKNIPDNKALYEDIKKIAVENGYNAEVGSTPPTKIDNIINQAIENNDYEGKSKNHYSWDFNTIKKEIDAGRPILLNITSGYYGNHTVTVVGYHEYERKDLLIPRKKKFIKVYDGWTESERYIDFDLLGMGSVTTVKFE